MHTIGWLLKRKVLLLALMAIFVTANAQRATYIEEHKPLTAELAAQFGIPNSVILAVAIVESAAGKCKMAKKLNNHFGMVGKNKLAKKGYKSRYKQYESEEDSFLDFCKLLSRKAFYPTLKNDDDPKKWVKAISKAGYSTQPSVWEKKVLHAISVNQL